MTNNPTIDGVSRELIAEAALTLRLAGGNDGLADDLRALLHAPVVERQPFAYYFKFAGYTTCDGPQGWRTEIELEKPADFLFADGRVKDFTPLYAAPPEVAALQSTIAQLQARIAELESGRLAVWYGAMPESNGKTNWTAILHRKGDPIYDGCCITLDRSEYPDRVRYEADRVRYLIGELGQEPFILDYDTNKHSGYTSPPAPVSVVLPERKTENPFTPNSMEWHCCNDENAEWNACLDATAALNEKPKQ